VREKPTVYAKFSGVTRLLKFRGGRKLQFSDAELQLHDKKDTEAQARRQPQRGKGKHSLEAPNIFTGPSGEKIFNFFQVVHSGVLYISG